MDSVDVGIVACRQQIPDVDRLMDTMRDDLAELVSRVGAAAA